MDDKYTILYIDEEPEEVRTFKWRLRKDFKVETIDPADKDLEEILEILDTSSFDYLIVDFDLNETSNIGYDGDTVLNAFLNKYPDFPSMLLTNHDQAAIENATDLDVERIRSKSEYNGEDEGLRESFIKRIKAKVTQYKNEHIKKENRLQELVTKRENGEELSAEEEGELIGLDTYLDTSLGGNPNPIPEEFKTTTNIERLNSLLGKTDTLLEEIEKYESLQK
jgi:DNA-binding NarL/FixJ family response regulator